MSDSAEIKPALTPAAWVVVQHYCPTGPHGVTASAMNCGTIGSHRHEAAAMALYGQPFGFTHEDVTLLLGDVEPCGADRVASSEEGEEVAAIYARLRSLADRIAALLPPVAQ